MRYKQDTTLIKKGMLIQQQASEMKDLKLSSFIWILISILILAISVFIYFYMKRKRDLQRMKYLDQVTKLRMKNIRNRISPHFIFNILNNEISSVEGEKQSNLYILVKLLRKSLEITEHISIPLSEELDFVRSYIDLEQQNLGQDFRLEWKVDSQISLDKTFVIPMIIQIPVENAIKHALRPKIEEKILRIHVTKKLNGVNILIQDNGPGYFPQQISQSKGTGTGFKVLYQTIQLLNTKNVEKIIFQMQNIKEKGLCGAEAEIDIPNNYKFE